MKISEFLLKNKIVLAPMAGISDLPYRRLMKRFGAGIVFTEMVSANGLVRSGLRTHELLASLPEERPLGIQLFGNDPAVVAEATRMVEDAGDLIDLNLGCPVPKVVRTGAGSALLRDPLLVARLVAAVRRATNRPLTIKLRSGWDSTSLNYLQIARIAVDEGADAVTLHPRTRAQGFAGRSQWDHIRQLKETLTVPVIGSGDIFNAADAAAMLEQTGCDAVMIARGAYGNPWLISDILARFAGRDITAPSLEERRQVALAHIALGLESYPERRVVLEMRKHLAWYARGVPDAARFRTTINGLQSLDALRIALDAFFSPSAEAA